MGQNFLCAVQVAIFVHRFGKSHLRLAQVGRVFDVVGEHLDAKFEKLRHRGRGLAGVVGVCQFEEPIHESLHVQGTLAFAERLPLPPLPVGKTGQHDDVHQHRCRHASPMAAHVFAQPVERRLGAGEHRPSVEITLNVGSERIDGGIAIFGPRIQALLYDGGQVAGQRLAQSTFRESAVFRCGAGYCIGQTVGLLFPDGPLNHGGHGCCLARPGTGQQFKQNPAQRVDVAQCGYGFIAQLLGTGVGRRGHDGGGQQAVWLDEFRGAKVQQLDRAVRGDENIGRLQIEMDNQVAMGIGNGVAHAQKELQPFVNPQLARIAIRVQMGAVHVFHDQVGLSPVAQAGIQHAGDVGMIERGEDVLFAVEAFNKGGAGRVGRQHLQGGAL